MANMWFPSSDDGGLCIWDVETGALACKPVRVHTDRISSVAFSHDGKHIVSGSYDETICVWDAETSTIISGPFVGHTSRVVSVTFSLDGTRVVSGSVDKAVCIWDVGTGTVVTEPFEGHTHEVSFVAFFPDNKRIFSFSTSYSASMVYIWDIESRAGASWEAAEAAYSVALSFGWKTCRVRFYWTMRFTLQTQRLEHSFPGHSLRAHRNS